MSERVLACPDHAKTIDIVGRGMDGETYYAGCEDCRPATLFVLRDIKEGE